MEDKTNDDNRTVEETPGDRDAGGSHGDGTSPPGETDGLRGGSAAAFVVPSGSANVASDLAAAPSTPPETEDEERVTKAKLIEYGRMLVKMKKAARRKARERAAKEKAQGLLTISLKCHKDDRRLIMGVMKSLNLTVEQMHKANLSTEPLEAAVTKLLREFYKAR